MTPTHEIVTQVTVTMPYSLLQIFVASAFVCGFISCLALFGAARLWKRWNAARLRRTLPPHPQRKPVEHEFYRGTARKESA